MQTGTFFKRLSPTINNVHRYRAALNDKVVMAAHPESQRHTHSLKNSNCILLLPYAWRSHYPTRLKDLITANPFIEKYLLIDLL